MRRLDHWCESLLVTFEPTSVYLVGSVQERGDWRDVDVRIVMDDEQVDALPMQLVDLNMLLSRWGQDQTGLPIDCQVQSASESQTHTGGRNPRGLARGNRPGHHRKTSD